MLKLKQSDPKAYEWMLHFLEAEYGGNAKQYYRSKKQRRRCNSLVNDAKSDAMNYAKSGTGCRLPSDLSHEDTVNELIDLRHVINAEEVEAKPKRKKKKSCDG